MTETYDHLFHHSKANHQSHTAEQQAYPYLPTPIFNPNPFPFPCANINSNLKRQWKTSFSPTTYALKLFGSYASQEDCLRPSIEHQIVLVNSFQERMLQKDGQMRLGMDQALHNHTKQVRRPHVKEEENCNRALFNGTAENYTGDQAGL